MRVLAALVCLTLISATATAQEREPAQRQVLVDLAYVIGESHALRQVCKGLNDQYWRQRMERLIETEAPEQGLRNRLIAAFNTGFVSGESQFTACSPASRAAESRVAAQGAAFARRLTAATVMPAPDQMAQTPGAR